MLFWVFLALIMEILIPAVVCQLRIGNIQDDPIPYNSSEYNDRFFFGTPIRIPGATCPQSCATNANCCRFRCTNASDRCNPLATTANVCVVTGSAAVSANMPCRHTTAPCSACSTFDCGTAVNAVQCSTGGLTICALNN